MRPWLDVYLKVPLNENHLEAVWNPITSTDVKTLISVTSRRIGFNHALAEAACYVGF
jgi:hypothetical protein